MKTYLFDFDGTLVDSMPTYVSVMLRILDENIMESVTCMLKSNLDYLGLDVAEIRAMGGGANSPLWCQMKADMTGKRLVTLKNKETACLGSAILAGVGTGIFASVEEAASKIELDKVYESKGVDYTECYERYLAYDKILNI